MELSRDGAAFMRGHEGFVPHAYLDPPGILTIGIGFTWRSAFFRQWWRANRPGQEFNLGATMTRDEAEAVLIYLCKHEYGKAVNAFLGKDVPQHVFDGTVSPVYNLGAGALEWKWAGAVKRGAYGEAAALLSKTGTTAGGKTLAGLVKRRADEADLIQFGDYTVGPMKADAMADGMLVRGERGPAVAQLLRDLHALGYYHGTLDDVFGYGAEAAVLSFQERNALMADGHAGPKTLRKIAEKIAADLAAKPARETAKAPEPAPAPPITQGKPKARAVSIVTAVVAVILYAIFGG
ncbi:lysozyme [Ensifer sp. MPMI2T]|nr:lysozyme [Ensifer sp. MPMI2T]